MRTEIESQNPEMVEDAHSADQVALSTDPPLPVLSPPGVILFTPNTIALATLFGSILAGCYLVFLNYRRMDKPVLARNALLVGSGTLIALVLVGKLLPGVASVFSFVLNIALIFGIRNWAQSTQGTILAEHVRSGGKMGSAWLGIGIGCLVTTLVMALLVVLSLLGVS